MKNKDVLQLQQVIIFLKSEIAKYQNEISTLQNMDYYSMVNSLELENNQLVNEKKELSLEMLKLRKTFEKELNDLHENIQVRENQRIKLISSIEVLVKEKRVLQAEINKLTKANKANDEKQPPLSTTEIQLPEQLLNESIENINHALRNFIEKNDVQLTALNEEILKSRDEAVEINQYLMKEIQHKSDQINMLISEINELKDQHAQKNASSTNRESIQHSKMLSQLDNLIKKLLTQAVNFEHQLDEKLQVLDDLEYDLLLLANKINHDMTNKKV